MKALGLFVNDQKELAVQVGRDVIAWSEQQGARIVLSETNARLLGRPDLGLPEREMAAVAELALVLGGDGTLLRAARTVAPSGTPILGVNLGQLGFLTELELPDMYPGLHRLFNGLYRIEERLMLMTTVVRGGQINERFYALNDIVVAKGAFSRMIQLETHVGGDYIATYSADGLIVSSPTGSTAYSLSAGGPIVSPDVEVMILTPICPHTLYSRPIVVSHQQQVRVKLRSHAADMSLTVDGQYGFHLEQGDEIIVVRSPFNAKLVRLRGYSFYQVMREKLQGEGGRDNS